MKIIPTAKSSIIEIWKERPFITLWLGQLVSGLGDQLYLIALPWLILELTGSITDVNIMKLAELFPGFLFGFVIGVYVDRLDRKKVMLATLGFEMLLIACIPLTHVWQMLNLGILYTIGFLLGIADRFYSVAVNTTVPVLFKQHLLTAANSQLAIAETVAQIMGPGLAGVLIGLIGATNTLFFDSFSFTFLVLAILLLPLEGHKTNRPKLFGLKRENQEALRWLIRSKSLWAATLGIVALNLFHVSVITLIIFYIRQYLHFSAQLTGLVFIIAPLGSFSAGFIVPLLANKIPKGKLMLYAMLPMGAAVILSGKVHAWWVLGLLIAVDQAGKSLWNACYVTLRQENTPQEMLGRIVSITSMITKIPILSLPLWGWLTDRVGVVAIFSVLGLGILISAVFLWNSPLPKAA